MKYFILFILIISTLVQGIFAADENREWKRVVELRGFWRFAIGDNPKWAGVEFDDSTWESIFAPSQWEDEDYPGYDGYAWYRKEFELEKIEDNLYIHLGRIDDVDEVYLNGKLVGFSGSFPPDFYTAYNFERKYHIPAAFLNKGKNIIAVRVFDERLAGGIIDGQLGIFLKLNAPKMVVPLSGIWKFSIGDSDRWRDTDYNDSHWEGLIVPMRWDNQGYKDFDGYAWYRFHFTVDKPLRDERMVVMLGKIDDLDETFLNGDYIGSTGYIDNNPERIEFDSEYIEVRAYRIDSDELIENGKNVLAVRVYDGYNVGGIWEGPVGIMYYSDYKKWQAQNFNGFQIFLDKLFR